MAGRQIGGFRGQEKLMHFAVYAITTSVSKSYGRDRAAARSSQQQHNSKISRVPVPYNMSEKRNLIGEQCWVWLLDISANRFNNGASHININIYISVSGDLETGDPCLLQPVCGDEPGMATWRWRHRLAATEHRGFRVAHTANQAHVGAHRSIRRILVTSRYHSAYRSASRSPFTLKA
ncbi:predicted protein [Histoplasma capsulatum var. duboisii H88]|uniref:Predicted protein n=2 Tax=Ajellomyces capsulatus TaxID=5037 RepID=F0UPU6_AJEC8|nr:predicted protein [Histoplasma capsulatum H143]EGC47841.1 predicted protein [Histoplasma capsulatum var. duboisii H88]